MKTTVLVGEALQKARLACGLDQAELARRAGVTQQAISKIENKDDLDVRVSTAQRIMRALHEAAVERQVAIGDQQEIIDDILQSVA